jgi:phosphorylcholine metabolism protein LicD
MRTYLSTMNDIGAETWIMHGSLLGWWWNRKIMPWDSDVDVQMSEGSMHYLAKYYNMTMHHFRLPGLDHGRDYLLEVNPHYVNGSTTDRLNVIDARWIDTESGLFIDITTLRVDRTADIKGDVPNMYCKDKHKYLYKDIFPLRDSDFEGAPVKVPYAYSELLEAEYGPKSLTNKQFENHFFDEEQQMWLPNGYVLKCVSYLPSQVTLVRGFLASERSNISICGRSKSNPTGRRTYLSHFRL